MALSRFFKKAVRSVVQAAPPFTLLLDPKDKKDLNANPKFKIINPNKEKFCVVFLGCYGSKSAKEKDAVAELADRVGKAHGAAYYFGAGDNFYNEGLKSPHDPLLQSHMATYRSKKVPYLKSKMFIQSVGNHDERLDDKSTVFASASDLAGRAIGEKQTEKLMGWAGYEPPPKEYGEAHGIHEVRATDQETIKNGELHPDQHLGWLLPNFSAEYDDNHVKIFAADSNTLLEYYHQYLVAISNDEKPSSATNQFVALQEAYQDALKNNQGFLLVEHHPWISPSKKRDEASTYLDALKRKQLDIIGQLNPADAHYLPTVKKILDTPLDKLDTLEGIPKVSAFVEDLGHQLRRCIAKNGIRPDQIITAHDHNIYFYNNLDDEQAEFKFCQLTTGGGGSSDKHLMPRENYSFQDSLGCFLRKNGVTVVTIYPEKPHEVINDIYTLDGLHLRFKNTSKEPVRDTDVVMDEKTETLRQKILKACFEYLRQPNVAVQSSLFQSVYLHDVLQDDWAHHLWAYVNQFTPPSFNDIKKQLSACLVALLRTDPKRSFRAILTKHLGADFQLDLDIDSPWEKEEKIFSASVIKSAENSEDSSESSPMGLAKSARF